MSTRGIIPLLVILAVSPGLWAAAPDAILQSLKGKVEVRNPGSQTWQPATEGEVLSIAATLSTGFDSSVVVVMGKSTLQVKPLTRMTIDKLVEEGGTLKTSTFLRVGSVAASVKSADGVKQDFKVQSPYSTASVRGTEFDFDGLNLKVTDGVVSFIPGRPTRDIQPATTSGGKPVTPPESDFAGAPDVTSDTAKAVPVAAGKDAKLVVTFEGAPPQTTSSGDLDQLQQTTGQVQTLPTAPTTPAPPAPPLKATTLILSIQFGP